MTDKIVDIELFRLTKAVARTEGMFEERFGFALEPTTTPVQMPDRLLAALIGGRAEATEFLQGLVIRLMGLGRGITFHYLDKADKMAVLDAYFVLLDQLRFEAMHRLGWLTDYPGRELPVALMALSPGSVKNRAGRMEVATDHPAHAEFEKRRRYDGEVVVRQLIPRALTEFIERRGPGDDPAIPPSPA